MIYTLEYLRNEANLIAGYWNGSDEKFIDGCGEERTEEDVEAAQELLHAIVKIENLIKELEI